MKWDEKQTLIFVKLFLSHKCLWDPTSLFYNSKYKKKEAYRSLVAKFHDKTNIQIDKMLVMTKIKNLRSTYARELKKMKKSLGGYKPKLPWFDEWHSCFWKHYSQNLKAKEVEPADSVEETNQLPDESDNDNESSEDIVSESQFHEEECNSLTPETPKKARMIRWNETQTHMFVKLYLRNRCLWDPTDKFFKLKFKRREAYRTLIPKFYALTNIRLNENLIMRKIRNLKKTYAYEIKKIKCREGYRPSITWFDDWHSCLWKHYSQTLKATEEHAHSVEETNQWPDDSDSDNKSSKHRVSESPLYEEECYLTLSPDSDIVIDTPHLKQQDRLQDQPESTLNEDEFDVYAKFIASQMRQLDKRKALKLQMQIHSLVNEARLEALADE